MKPVSILKTENYQPDTLRGAVERHFALLGLDKLLRPGLRVALKPNLLMARTPETATTTHPAFVEAIIVALKERGITDLVLAESPGGPFTEAALRYTYKTTGMGEVARRQGISLNVSTDFRAVNREQNQVCRGFNIIEAIASADLCINICKIKTHSFTGFSGAVKNMFGCVPGLQKAEMHFRFQDRAVFGGMLVDLCQTVPPVVSFVDGVVGMEGDGPSGGAPIALGFTAASEDPYMLDLLLCKIMGIDPMTAAVTTAAHNRGLCPAVLDEGCLVGDLDRAVKVPYKAAKVQAHSFLDKLPVFLRPAAGGLARRFFAHSPIIRTRDCIGCGKCAEICPAKTIDIKAQKASIRYQNCIRCFCCHEICPVKAIDIKRLGLFRG